jgi:hypothetical protein
VDPIGNGTYEPNPSAFCPLQFRVSITSSSLSLENSFQISETTGIIKKKTFFNQQENGFFTLISESFVFHEFIESGFVIVVSFRWNLKVK